MNTKRIIGIIFTILVLLLLAAGARSAQTRDVAAEALRTAPLLAPPAAVVETQWMSSAAAASLEVAETISGAIVTQEFTLSAGWNAIYLGVEPVNGSALGDDGVPTQSVLEWVFRDLAASGALESVWAYNQPASRMDYIVDPSEGLWDQPGWDRYFPEGNQGPDNVSREFLTTLLNLHANTGYLVKLKDDFSGTAILAVTGPPVVGHRRWAATSYSLVGFPLLDPGPTVATIMSSSAITDVLTLDTLGHWQRLGAADTLQNGEAYLAYYGDATNGRSDYTAPLDLTGISRDGLAFTRVFSGTRQSLQSFLVENLIATPTTFDIELIGGADAAVALRYSTGTETVDLRTAGPQTVELGEKGPYGAKNLDFVVLAGEQRNHGEALLKISSAQAGTRWLIPVEADGGTTAGLWIGEAVVNDVSESRLGATNVASGALTVALRQQNGSGIRGGAEMSQIVTGSTSSVVLTVTLALPSTQTTTPPQPLTGTKPYVGGYVFVDGNQNGQRDLDEIGIPNVIVTMTPAVGEALTATTAADGLYLFQNVSTGTHALALNPAPAGYTATFDVTLPETQTLPVPATPVTALNALPDTVGVDATGITALEPETYRRQTLPPPYTLPVEDANGSRVEPALNFGLVPAYDVSLWTASASGGCQDRLEKQPVDLGSVVNGIQHATIDSAALNPLPDPVTYQLLGGGQTYAIYVEQAGADNAPGQGVACGELVVGAPTASAFRFRLILRVANDGATELLPYYSLDPPTNTLRISSAAFSMPAPLSADNSFNDTAPLLGFSTYIASQDPLNPFKHKYQPDHDDLDVTFNPINLDELDPYYWESYPVRRRITLELTDDPPGVTGEESVSLDWGGATWGGNYREVVTGLHKNDITAAGYFVIQQVLTCGQLKTQDFDAPGGGLCVP